MKKIIFVLALLCATSAFAAERESAYDRVMKTQTIKCGYGTNRPWIYKDDTTGKMAGLNVTIMEKIAGTLGLSLSWPEETGWAEVPTALSSGRVDVACSALWNDPVRGRQTAYTDPVFYQPIYVYARADDTRFTGKIEELNDPSVRISVQEGDFGLGLAQRFFPKATHVTIPQQAAWTDIYMNIITKKADVTFIDAVNASNFNKNNDNKLRRIPLTEPMAIYGLSYAVSIHEPALKEMINSAVRYMIQTGQIEELTADFRKEYPDAIILPKKPF